MSIFGGQDVLLPIITQALQIDYRDLKEVEVFYLRAVALGEISTAGNNKYIQGMPGMGTGEHRPAPKTQREAFDQAMERAPGMLESYTEEMERQEQVSPLHQLGFLIERIHIIMETIYKSEKVPFQTLHEVRRFIQPPSNVINAMLYLNATGQDPDKVDLIPLRYFDPIHIYVFTDPTFYIVWAMEELLLSLWRGDKLLKCCEECKHVYVAEKETARFCSHRCTSRVGHRRRRQARRYASLSPEEKVEFEQARLHMEKRIGEGASVDDVLQERMEQIRVKALGKVQEWQKKTHQPATI